MITPEIFAALSQLGFAETDFRANPKQALLDILTKEELELYYLYGSAVWCGTNREESDIRRIKTILAARNNPDYKGFAVEYLQSQIDEWKPPSLWQRLLQFLF